MEQPQHREPRLRKRDRLKRRLVDAVRFYRRTTWLAVAAAIVLAVAVGVMAFDGDDHEPEVVPLGTGVAGVMKDTTEVERPAPPPEPEAGREIRGGEASYYGSELAGNRTASGERFDPAGMTAAHRTLPLGTRLRVVNPANEREVIVRVNDRGPYHGNRVIDLSEAAARRLGLLQRGRGQVRMFVLE